MSRGQVLKPVRPLTRADANRLIQALLDQIDRSTTPFQLNRVKLKLYAVQVLLTTLPRDGEDTMKRTHSDDQLALLAGENVPDAEDFVGEPQRPEDARSVAEFVGMSLADQFRHEREQAAGRPTADDQQSVADFVDTSLARQIVREQAEATHNDPAAAQPPQKRRARP